MQKDICLKAEFLVFLLEGGRAFVNPKELLEDLSAEDALRELAGINHSIARIIAHLQYWQNWFYEGAMGKAISYPEKNDKTFPTIRQHEWESLRSSFLHRLIDIKALCHDADLMARPFSQEAMAGGHDQRTVAMTLLYTVALHNAHHYGQIISLRQFMQQWPPKAGSMTW